MRIVNVAVEQVGTSTDGRNLLIGRGHDSIRGWAIWFVVPITLRDRVLADVRAGKRPVIPVPEVDALPWTSVPGVRWE
jgi:hypothetical protein